nr:hypothetical protein [Tanacetum cinerariifolium]
MEEVKGLIKQIKIPSGTPLSSSQPSSSKATKQKTWFRPCKEYGFKNHLSDDCYSKPKCSTCGSTDHLTKEYLEYAAVKKKLSKLKAQLPLKPSPKKSPMIPKPFKECKYYGFNDHHSDHYEFYFGCEVCSSIAHEPSDYSKKHPNSKKPRIANRQSEPTKKDHLGKFNEQADDGLFLGYSLVAKSFRVFNIRRQEMEEKDSDVALASECLYVNFLSEVEPKKLIEALEEEGWIIAMQEELNQFKRNKYDLADYASAKCYMLPPNNMGPDESGVSVNETLFRGMIGSLMYLTASRPDIQFSTCLCVRYQANPKESYLVAVKRIFGKSTLGGCQMLGGKLVCWSEKKQSSVVMSSIEAEYVVATRCCAQVL